MQKNRNLFIDILKNLSAQTMNKKNKEINYSY